MSQNQRPPHIVHAVIFTGSWAWTAAGLAGRMTTEALFAEQANGRVLARKAAWSSGQGSGQTCRLRSAGALHSFLLSAEREEQG